MRFLAASRAGDFEALVAVLAPDVVFCADRGRLAPAAGAPSVVTGAPEVAQQILTRGSPFARYARPAIVNGAAGVIVAPAADRFAVIGFTVVRDRIVEIDVVVDQTSCKASGSTCKASERPNMTGS